MSRKETETRILAKFDQWLNDYADLIFQYSQEHLINEEKPDTGNLHKTANIRRLPYEKLIIYPAPYAESVHYGRAPGSMPPVSALQKWAERKLQLSPKEATRASWAIAKAIKERGIAPTPFLTIAIQKANQKMGVDLL